jgi:3-deoxy-D-manno-octulosonic-acid transferase
MTWYDLAYVLAIIATAPLWLAVPRWRRKVLDVLRERNGKVAKAEISRPGLLIHAVSMGEINATPHLVRVLSETLPDLRFLITTTSRTGANRARELYEKNPNVTLLRFPFDFTPSIRRMLDAQQPMAVVLMELEVWPNFMRECDKRRIPVLLVNGRLSASSFRGYKLAGLFTRPMFERLTRVCVQEQAFARRFERLGVFPQQISVTGTMKFDTAQVVVELLPGADQLALSVGLGHAENEKTWVCGSTGPGEEKMILSAYAELRVKFPSLRLVIVPRHPERFNEVAELITSRGYAICRRSTIIDLGTLAELDAADPNAVILGDTMGELRKFYSLADVVFVGRSLVDLGSKQHGSDMIEPAGLAKPIIIGPFTGNFFEVMNRFREANALREVHTQGQLRDTISDLLLAPIAAKEIGLRAQDVVRKNQGATGRHAEVILEYLPPPRVVTEAEMELEDELLEEDELPQDELVEDE